MSSATDVPGHGRVALVLSGGGSRGAFEAGVVAAIEDAGLAPCVVSGTSAGAVNAAGLAAGFSAARLEGLWTSLEDRDVYRMRWDVWNLLRPSGLLRSGSLSERLLRSVGWTWLWDWRPLRRTLVDIFDGEAIPLRGPCPLVVSTVEVTTGDLVRYATAAPPRPREDIVVVDPTVDHLIASAAIPLLFKPGRLDGEAFWDGGIVANTPLAPALAWEPDAVIVVTTTTLRRPAPVPRNVADAITLLLDTVQRFTLETDLRMVDRINRLVAAQPGRGPERAVEVLLIEPAGLDLGDGLNFDPAQAKRVFDLGRRVGEQRLEEWLARSG